jgi:hypothetical protein
MKTSVCSAIVFCLVAAAAFAQTQPSSAPSSADSSLQAKSLTPFQQSIIEVQKAFLAAEERGDRQYVDRAVAQDFMAIDSNGSTADRADLVESVRPSPPHKQAKEEKPILYFFNVIPLNDNAAVVSYNAVRPGDYPRYVHVSNTWVKENGDWKLKFAQSTPNIWSAADLD